MVFLQVPIMATNSCVYKVFLMSSLNGKKVTAQPPNTFDKEGKIWSQNTISNFISALLKYIRKQNTNVIILNGIPISYTGLRLK